MEKYEIRDCVQLRALAYAFALSNTIHGKMDSMFLREASDKIFNYIKGDADIPEYVNPMDSTKLWSDMLDNINVGCKTINMWVKPEKMLPQSDVEVLTIYTDEKGELIRAFGAYLGNGVWEVNPADMSFSTNRDNIEVVAWMPIPEYIGE